MDEVIRLDVPWDPDAGAPQPVVFQREGHPARVVYLPSDAAPPSWLPLAVLRFPRCEILKFGYPNDEALAGHPLYAHGLGAYGIFEVIESSWLETIHEQNRVSFPDGGFMPSGGRHFVVTFHDTTFECIADHLEGRFADSWKSAWMDSEDAVYESV